MKQILRLSQFESGQIAEHLLRLDANDRRSRFCAAASDDFIEDYVARLDWTRIVLFGYIEGGRVHGLAELVADRLFLAASAEAAFSVEQPWRRRGLARAMMKRVLITAGIRLIRQVHLFMLSGNIAMRRLADASGFSCRCEDGEIHATLDVTTTNVTTADNVLPSVAPDADGGLLSL